MYVFPEAKDAQEVVEEAMRKAEEFKADAVMMAQSYYTQGSQIVKC